MITWMLALSHIRQNIIYKKNYELHSENMRHFKNNLSFWEDVLSGKILYFVGM